MSAVGQGGERCCTLLYSLRLLPERLQAVAPGCSNFALATWIHRHTDPWLTLQVALLGHTIQYCTDASNYFKVVNSKLRSQGCHLRVAYLHIFNYLGHCSCPLQEKYTIKSLLRNHLVFRHLAMPLSTPLFQDVILVSNSIILYYGPEKEESSLVPIATNT